MSNTYKTGKYKGDAFKPRPELRVDPKSRRHHPVCQAAEFCIRKSRCKNATKCDECFKYSMWEERQNH